MHACVMHGGGGDAWVDGAWVVVHGWWCMGGGAWVVVHG